MVNRKPFIGALSDVIASFPGFHSGKMPIQLCIQ